MILQPKPDHASGKGGRQLDVQVERLDDLLVVVNNPIANVLVVLVDADLFADLLLGADLAHVAPFLGLTPPSPCGTAPTTSTRPAAGVACRPRSTGRPAA